MIMRPLRSTMVAGTSMLPSFGEGKRCRAEGADSANVSISQII
jgi:hypothetical protein